MNEKEIKATRAAAVKIYDWCKKKYGRSKYNGRYPDLFYRKGDRLIESIYGIYDCEDNYIYINKDNVDTIEELASTIIHEYTHYKQNIRVDYTVLSKYFDPFTENHPLEKEAEDVSKRDYKQCLYEVFGINIE